ncbi:hypothetical protein GCM10009430_45960 [Aquimarina litoralis]|uniref:HTH araC/xylS-type domain-containing protein n=1 Tax=Aquimarina litoralis TaxID=584605 RepID=A0ABN1J937_9FLAO
MIYFYIKSLINPEFRFKLKNGVHFIPFIIAQTYAFIVYFSAIATNDFNEKDQIAESFGFNFIKPLEEYILLFLLPFYLFYSYKELTNYKKWLNNTTSDSTFPDFNWLNSIFKLSIGIGTFLLINHSLDIFFNLSDSTILHYHLLTLFIAFTIYYLGLKGYLQPDYAFDKIEINLERDQSYDTDNNSAELIDQIQKVMTEDKVYLNPKLSMYELSNMLGMSQKRVSSLINQHFKMSFREYVNKYRIEEVKAKLDDSNYKNMSILGIALECGFNSEASFYRIFKKSTNLTPKEYIQKKEK